MANFRGRGGVTIIGKGKGNFAVKNYFEGVILGQI
jgi:hypothetical protein